MLESERLFFVNLLATLIVTAKKTIATNTKENDIIIPSTTFEKIRKKITLTNTDSISTTLGC